MQSALSVTSLSEMAPWWPRWISQCGSSLSYAGNLRVMHCATENGPLNDGQIPNVRVARVTLGTGYTPGEVNRWASRNGRVSDLPPEIPTSPSRAKVHTSLGRQ